MARFSSSAYRHDFRRGRIGTIFVFSVTAHAIEKYFILVLRERHIRGKGTLNYTFAEKVRKENLAKYYLICYKFTNHERCSEKLKATMRNLFVN